MMTSSKPDDGSHAAQSTLARLIRSYTLCIRHSRDVKYAPTITSACRPSFLVCAFVERERGVRTKRTQTNDGWIDPLLFTDSPLLFLVPLAVLQLHALATGRIVSWGTRRGRYQTDRREFCKSCGGRPSGRPIAAPRRGVSGTRDRRGASRHRIRETLGKNGPRERLEFLHYSRVLGENREWERPRRKRVVPQKVLAVPAIP